MISGFASFIELFSAIYLTISLDDLLLRRFWTPDYAKRLELGLRSITMPELVKRPTVTAAADSSKREESRSRKRGMLLFALTVQLLIIIGCEDTLLNIGQIGLSCLYCLLFLLTLIFYVFDDLFLKTWKRVLLSVVFLSMFIVFYCYFLPLIGLYKPYIDERIPLMNTVAKVAMIFTLLTPVLWQLIRNRIYTHYYLLYILNVVNEKAKEYSEALAFDTKKGHKMSDVAKPYLDVTGQAIASGDEDRSIKPFLDVLQRELSSITYVPSLLLLVKYSYKTYAESHYSKHKLDRLYKLYMSKKPLPKMEKFCEEEGIDYNALHGYHLRKLK